MQSGRRAAAVLLERCMRASRHDGRFHALLHEGASGLAVRAGRVAGVVTPARTCVLLAMTLLFVSPTSCSCGGNPCTWSDLSCLALWYSASP